MIKLNQQGFSIVEAVLILVVIGILGFIGWRVYDANKAEDTTNTTTQTESTDTPIEEAEDLDAAAAELNNEDIDAQLDTSELDEALTE